MSPREKAAKAAYETFSTYVFKTPPTTPKGSAVSKHGVAGEQHAGLLWEDLDEAKRELWGAVVDAVKGALAPTSICTCPPQDHSCYDVRDPKCPAHGKKTP